MTSLHACGEEGRPPLKPLIKVHETTRSGEVYRDARVRVTCATVDHYTVKPAFAFRFDTPKRSIVVSGDTTYSDHLIDLARGGRPSCSRGNVSAGSGSTRSWKPEPQRAPVAQPLNDGTGGFGCCACRGAKAGSLASSSRIPLHHRRHVALRRSQELQGRSDCRTGSSGGLR